MMFGHFFFFFKQKTAYGMRISDWSSDVCSSDLGIASAIELRSPSLSSWLGGAINELRLVGFADSARVWIKNPLPDQQDSLSLIGVGAGLRVKLFGHVNGDLDVA